MEAVVLLGRVAVRVGLIPLVVLVLRWAAPAPARLAATLDDPAGRVREEGLDVVVAEAAGALGWLVLLWAAAGVLLVGATRLPGAAGRASEVAAGWSVPARMRGLATVALGLTVVAATSDSALAATPTSTAAAGPPLASGCTWWVRRSGPVDRPPATAHREPSPPGIDWPLETRPPRSVTVDWPLHPAGDEARSGPARSRSQPRVVVSVGDTLWSIAARRLGSGASPSEIAAAWPRWHQANRAVIGPDPARLRPGQLLRVPPAP